MGRAKNKKPNVSAAAAKTPAASAQQQPLQQPSAATASSSPAAADVRPRTSPSRTRPATPESFEILDVLRPYEQLLPALRGVELPVQQRLHRALYSAGCTAAEALETYLKDKSLALKQLEGGDASTGTSSESEELRLLLNYVSVEMAAENLRKVCSGPDGKILLRDAENKILNEVAAAALAAFAAAASRRPSTKHVEYMMNRTTSLGAADDSHSQSSQLTGVVAAAVSEQTNGGEGRRDEPKGPPLSIPAEAVESTPDHLRIGDVQLPLPPTELPVLPFATDAPAAAPYPRAVNTSSTGTNTSAGYPVAIGGKTSRKRPAPHPVRRERADVMVDTSGDEVEELDEDEDDYSDAELDEESEVNSADHLDASRHSETPIEDFDYTDALLRFACTVGHVDIVKGLVEIRGCAEYQSTHKSTMLMEACCAGQTKVVQTLLDQEADVNAISDSQNTALIYAASAGKLDCVRQLLRNPDIQIDMRNQSGHTALMEASSAGHLEIVEELLEHGADIFAIVENVDFKESSLSLASYRGHVEVVSALLRAMPDCEDRMEELHAGLLEAAMDGHVDVARVLLDGGAPVNLPTENFESPLTLAACGGHYDLVHLLVERGADLEEPNDDGYTPLMEAAREGHQDVVELLLDHGANVNAKIEEGIETPLSLAASGGYLQIVKILVSHGGDLSIGERTPLYEATHEGHANVVKFILQQLKKNADQPNVIEDLNNALVSAAETDSLELVKLFLENGAQISCFSKEGRTPLMEAAKEGHLEVVEYLVNRGACVNKVSPTNDATALSLACLCGRAEVTKYLLKKGANAEVVLKDSVSCIIEASRNGNTDCARIILDHMGVKGKEPAGPQGKKPNGTMSDIPIAKPAELSQRPKIKPVHKLQGQQQQREPITQTVGTISVHKIPAKPSTDAHQQQQQQPVCTCTDLPPSLTAQQQQAPPDLTSLLAQKMSPEWAAAASANTQQQQQQSAKTSGQSTVTVSKQRGGPPTATTTTTTKQRHPAGGSSTTTTTTATITATPMDPQNAAEILQQFPADLMSSMMAAAANASMNNSNTTSAMAVDESMLAHFIQRSLIEPKRRDAAWTDQELAAFKDLVRQKMRTLNPAAMSTPSISTSVQQQQITDLIDEHQEFMVANMLSGTNLVGLNAEMGECPGCAHQHAPQYASSVHSKLGNAPPPNVLPAAGGSSSTASGGAGRSVADSLANTNSILSALQNARSGVDDEMDRLQRPTNDPTGAAAAQLPLKRKGSAIKSRPAGATATTETSGTYGSQRVSGIRTSVIQSPVYYNRTLTGTSGAPALTPEQQQQIIFYQQQEYHNLQNLQTAAGHHHVTSTTGAFQSATPACHPGAHVHPVAAAAAQMSNLGQQMHQTSNRATRRTAQSGKHPKTCSGHGVNGHPTMNGVSYGDYQQDPEGAKFKTTDDFRDDVASYVDVQTDANNDTALTVACVGGHASLVSLLIQRGANVEHRDKKGFTPLILAATGGHVNCCKMLIEAGCQIDAQSERTKDTALSLACSGGRKEVVELLLRCGANKEHRNVSDYTPLSLAASGGYVDIIHLLLDAGAEINSRTGSKLGISPLMLAAMNGHDAATLMLLERGSDINAQIETNRNTALTLACFQGRTEVVRLLLKFGANVEHRAKTGLTPLMEAANGGYTDVGALLLKHGADPNAPPVPTSRDTALTIAADKGHSTFVSMLLNQCAFIDVKNKKGCTPLFLACGNGHLETVKILVKRRADVDALDNRKTTPLVAAFRKGFVKVVEFMVQHVNQFPNDLECARFYNNLTDADLAAKVKECLDVIMDAKAKQAEQANRAAESLLEQLAEEEALAESKKQSKKRLKEKKKAKKLAKRAAEVDDEETTAADAQIEEDEEEPPPPPASIREAAKLQVVNEIDKTGIPSPPPVFSDVTHAADRQQPPAMSKSQMKKAKQAAARAATAAATSATAAVGASKENTPDEAALAHEDPRVPQTFNEVPSANESSEPLKTTNGKEGGSRRQNRRGRGEKEANGQPSTTTATSASRISIQPNATIMTSPQHSPNVTAKSSSSYSTNAGNNSAEESEWLSASKRRASSRPGKDSSTTNATNADRSSSSKDPLRDLVRIMKENPQVSEAWSMTEPNSKRRAFAIAVSSSTVARIIGRAGQNINAIREATNAHIEVEKIATRREQSTRQITVKGSPDSIRNAITMMDLLVRETDAHVNDVIRRVTRTDAVNSPTTVAAGTPVVLPPIVALDKQAPQAASPSISKQPSTTPPATYVSFATSAVRSTSSTSSAGALTAQNPTTTTSGGAAATTTNVWQQRAAIRKMQQTNDTPSATPSAAAAQPAAQPPSASTSASASPIPHAPFAQLAAFNPPSGNVGGEHPTETTISHNADLRPTTDLSDAPTVDDFALQLEELKRKAPGFERPSAQPTPIKSTTITNESRVDEISALLAGAESKSGLGYPFNGADNTKFLSGFLNDRNPSSGAQSTATNVRVGSAGSPNTGGERATQRPLSEIWNTPSATSTSNLAEEAGFAGLFGSDPKSAASLWLPPTSADLNKAGGVKDDTWIDTYSLFPSLGIGELGSAGVGPSVAPIGTKSAFGAAPTSAARPHSSTDWTAAGSPWASSGLFGGPPTAQQQQQLGTAYWSSAAGQSAMSNGPPGVISPPKTSALSSSGGGLMSGAAIARPSPSSATSASSNAANRMPANWQAVFNQMAQQLGDVAEKEKQQKAAAAAAQANVYAPYATAAMDDRLQFNGLLRGAAGMQANEQPPIGGIAPPHSVAAQPQGANHSSVLKNYLDSMPKDFDLNLAALSNTANEQLRQSFYAAQMAAHQQQAAAGGVFGGQGRPMPSMAAPIGQQPQGGTAQGGGFIQPPPGFGTMPPAPRAQSMTPVQQLQQQPPMPNGSATAAAAAAGWSQQPYASAFDSIWKQRR